MSSRMVQSKINGLALDVSTQSPVVILAPLESVAPEEEKVLPIWIGPFEAQAIAMELAGIPSKRPLTHDLIKAVITSMGGKIEKIEVTELVNQTFYAKIYVSINSHTVEIDARPSDSLALALKAKAPIFVNDLLFQDKKDKVGGSSTDPQTGESPDSLRERLRRINPEDFGKYSL